VLIPGLSNDESKQSFLIVKRGAISTTRGNSHKLRKKKNKSKSKAEEDEELI